MINNRASEFVPLCCFVMCRGSASYKIISSTHFNALIWAWFSKLFTLIIVPEDKKQGFYKTQNPDSVQEDQSFLSFEPSNFKSYNKKQRYVMT